MNIIKKTVPCFDEVEYTHAISYYTYDGWSSPVVVTKNGYLSGEALDLSNVIRFTDGERELNKLGPNEEWQSFGCYKKL